MFCSSGVGGGGASAPPKGLNIANPGTIHENPGKHGTQRLTLLFSKTKKKHMTFSGFKKTWGYHLYDYFRFFVQ